MEKNQQARLTNNIRNTVVNALQHTKAQGALVIYDTQSEITKLLLAAYTQVFSEIGGKVQYVDFDATGVDQSIAAINACVAGDLVVLVQTANFRLNEFRIRIELFQRKLKTIEHSHTGRMTADQYDALIDLLAYDASYYRSIGPAIKAQLEAAPSLTVECFGGTKLTYNSKLEEPRLNIGDYSGMENVGGSFPIGEVFTEAQDLYATNGEMMVFGFGALTHYTQIVKPFKVVVKDGILVDAPDAPQEFQEILSLIRSQETVLLREIGFGLNKAVSKDRIVNDTMSFERQYGLHVSLGHKHAVYKKPGLVAKHTKYHMDIFIDVERILAGDVVIFENGKFAADTSKT